MLLRCDRRAVHAGSITSSGITVTVGEGPQAGVGVTNSTRARDFGPDRPRDGCATQARSIAYSGCDYRLVRSGRAGRTVVAALTWR